MTPPFLLPENAYLFLHNSCWIQGHEFTDCIILLEVGPFLFFFKMEIVPLSPPQCTCLSLEEDSSAVALFFKLLLTLNPFQHEHYLCIFFSCVFSVKY